MLKSYIQNVELIRTIRTFFSGGFDGEAGGARQGAVCSKRLCAWARGRPHGWLQPAGRSGQRPAALLAAGRRGQRPATWPGAAMRTGQWRRARAGGSAARPGAAAHRAGGRWRSQEQRCEDPRCSQGRRPLRAKAAAAHAQVGGGGGSGC